ncbi:MAG: hypothetical protein L6455_13660 [Kiritimatiellae bacterium]|nr:hypothetical protein [Kiritimatiellia bacterium]
MANSVSAGVPAIALSGGGRRIRKNKAIRRFGGQGLGWMWVRRAKHWT